MARAHRHYFQGQIWHLTHRCHQRQFLLQFRRDRRAWRGWLYEARKRWGMCVLDGGRIHPILACVRFFLFGRHLA
ncbi:MAG: hypothetical protein LAO31_11935 [Acidobacteriia bacterium]|nr:hypothetical protein [Terriglobia bacterium]